MTKKHKMKPLTEEQRTFAEENHYLINAFITKNRLNYNDFYDVLALRYMTAVQRYFELPDLRQYKFSTIAFGAMRSAMGNERNKFNRYRKNIAFSLDENIPGTEISRHNSVADPASHLFAA